MSSEGTSKSSLRILCEKICSGRESSKNRITENERLYRYLQAGTTVMLSINALLIVLSLIIMTCRMVYAGLPLLDALPIALYILPLLFILPSVTWSYYQNQSSLAAIIILIIASVILGLISPLIRSFIVLLSVNIFAILILLITGNLRPKGSLKETGKKGIVVLILLNLVALMFPVSIFVMGEYPITTVNASDEYALYLEVPLSSFSDGFTVLTPDNSTINALTENQFGIDLRFDPMLEFSWSMLEMWLLAINDTDLGYSVTISANRTAFLEERGSHLATTSVLETLYDTYIYAVDRLFEFINSNNVYRWRGSILLDMTLSHIEWETIMEYVRNVDLMGFSVFTRNVYDSIDTSVLESSARKIESMCYSNATQFGYLIENFLIDDFGDSDPGILGLCGVSETILHGPNANELLCSRTRFSDEMNGDVGEYFVYSYTKSLQSVGITNVRLGIVGTDESSHPYSTEVYQQMEEVAEDIVVAGANGASVIRIGTLPTLIESFGENAIRDLVSEIEKMSSVEITYTFRIFAFRAVLMMIDSYDPMKL